MQINLFIRGLLIIFNTMILSLTLYSPASASDGKVIYEANCKSCHTTGVGGAPTLQDKSQWNERLQKGLAGLVEIAINGIQGYGGVMPPRGGNASLSDNDVKAAVAYMVEQVKQ